MNCPLCNESVFLNLKKFRISNLKEKWFNAFGFDPFKGMLQAKELVKKRCISCDLTFFDPPFFGDGNFYSHLSKNAWYYEADKWEYDIAMDIIIKHKPSSILEVGCGEGFFLEKLSSSGVDIEGIDINEVAIDVCSNKRLAASCIDIFSIKKSFDMIVLFEVLEHMDQVGNLIKLLSEKVLNPGGYLVIAVPNPKGYYAEIPDNLLDKPPHHNSAWSYACFESLQNLFPLQIVDYHKEKLRLIHYQGLLQGLLTSVNQITKKSWKQKLFSRFQSILVRLLSPFTYIRDRELIEGQTHLVVYKSTRG